MENAVKVEIETKDGAITQKLLSKDVREEVCLPNMNGYLTVSASRPMLPLFVLNSLDKGKIAILHTVPPIERYLPTPCKISMCYRDSAMVSLDTFHHHDPENIPGKLLFRKKTEHAGRKARISFTDITNADVCVLKYMKWWRQVVRSSHLQ